MPLKDETGRQYGSLSVLECVGRDKRGEAIYRCRCVCGKETFVRGGDLRNGHSKSCGCQKRLLKNDLTGRQFGRLLVTGIAHKVGKKQYYSCVCSCGSTLAVRGDTLLSGRTVSCGCHNKEIHTTHNMSRTRIYHIYQGMLTRTTNENDHNYHHYGGRGITVCDEWKNNPASFVQWSLQNGYADDLTLDRIDVNGDYSPVNCRWADLKTQGRNRRNNVVLTYEDDTKTVTEWAIQFGVDRNNVYRRLKCGWSFEEAFEIIARKRVV